MFYGNSQYMSHPNRIRFASEPDAFHSTVRERVNAYFSSNKISRYANGWFFVKAFVLIAMHICLYAAVLGLASEFMAMICYVVMGPMSIMIGINASHDAAHGSISKKSRVNSMFMFLYDILGANSYMWKKRHVLSHHAYPNILNEDADLKQNPLVRIYPSDKLLRAHKYQHYYAPVLYLIYTLNWLLFRDISDFFKRRIGSFEVSKIDNAEYWKLFIFKLLYLGYILGIPMAFSVLGPVQVVVGYLAMNFAASILITVAILPSHVSADSEFPLPDENGIMPHSWSHHQVITTIDFATSNAFLNNFFGGFNHHVTHHLFPDICHVHYNKITPIVRATAEEFGIPYKHESSLWRAYRSHYKLLKRNGSKMQHAPKVMFE